MQSTPDLGFILNHAWLIPGIPFFSFLTIALCIRRLSPKAAGVVATASVLLAAFGAGLLAWEYFHLFPAGAARPALVPWSAEWLVYQKNLVVSMGVLVDPISVLLMVVVTTVSALIHLYSIGYMRGDPGFSRYFTFLNLFTFSMLGLVVAPNILQMYVFWELVGVSSFLLIGFYYSKPAAVAAAKKAFIVTRFADLGFFIGVLMLSYYGYRFFGEVGAAVSLAAGGAPVQPFDFSYLTSPEVLAKFAQAGPVIFGISLLTLAMALIFMGAAGKSAMFPLHIWLPDAMEGPTPVSALIHAATMVVAGVYLVARMFPVFAASGAALLLVAGVGAFTSIFAAVIACTQDDIKRVLAFSTLSQLGYMMFALGVATLAQPLGYTASMFHLATHAFFKALLFLGAGAVIHAVHSNEIWEMGGLARKMPVTHVTFLVATLALAGIWPFAGFFSKDEILASALATGHTGIFALGLVVAGLTAFYMFRIYFVAFWGQPRGPGAEHAHEAPLIMLLPLAVLAVLSGAAGFIPMGDFVSLAGPGQAIGAAAARGHAGHSGVNLAIAVPASVLALLGIGLAWLRYGREAGITTGLAGKLGFAGPPCPRGAARSGPGALGQGRSARVYTVIKNKFYFDELYLFVTKQLIFRLVAAPIAWFDRHIVDGGVNLSGWCARKSGYLLSFLQTGQVQTYGVWFVSGSIIALVLILWAAKMI